MVEQNPVAWMDISEYGVLVISNDTKNKYDKDNAYTIPLYTKLTRRLTDDEMEQVFQEMWSKDNGFDVYFFAKAIENKLLEVNNG